MATALEQFNINIEAADRLVAMYRELRIARGLGARGVLDANNQDLLWIPRSSVVASISAFDTYVHSVVKRRLPRLFQRRRVVPDSLAERLAQLISIRNAASFRDALPLLVGNDPVGDLLAKFEDQYLQFQSFQAPEKVIEAYKLIGCDAIFSDVSAIWPGPNTTESHIKRRLAGYVQRRNQIAHEGDVEHNGTPRPMQPDYAVNCKNFVTNLVTRLNQVVYGV